MAGDDVLAPLFPALFDRRAAAHPDRPAVVADHLVWSYADLAERADRVAAALGARHLPPASVIGVCLGRSPWTIAAILGIWRAGAAFLPLDPTYPVARLGYMARDCGLAAILTERAALPVASEAVGARLPKLLAEDLEAEAPGAPRAPSSVSLRNQDPAYVMYTSGSTGEPKGVLVPHRGIGNLAVAQGRLFGVSASSRVLQFASIGFDAFIAEMVVALAAGASLHLARRDDLIPVRPLQRLLTSRGITHATLPPSLLAAMPEHAVPAELSLILAGEASGAPLVARYAPNRRLFNAYGPTEATVCATMGICQADGQPPAIGAPLPHVRVLVADMQGTEVPHGAAGEIWIGGIGVARGYVNRPELTAERFPIRDGMRWYRTGDLGRRRDDGAFDFLGRMDRQVKIRGHRIELEELEAVLAAHPSVEAAAVVERGEAEQRQLVAFVTGSAGALPAADRVRDHLAARLPAWMLPGLIVPIPRFPLTTSGKIDRKRLEDMARQAGTGLGSVLGPRDAAELGVSLIMAEVLGHARIGVHDDFMALGGDSLAAARVIAGIEAELGHRLPLSAFLTDVTPARLAARIRAGRAPDAWSPVARLAPGAEDEPLILVHPAGGSVLAYADLARAFGGRRAVLGLQASGYEPGQAALSDVGAMARSYLDALAPAIRPRRWCFAGWSFGALIALEMTRQARQAGWPVAPPIAIDAAFHHPHMDADSADIVQRVVKMYGDMLGVRPPELADGSDLAALVEAAVGSGIFPPDFDVAQAHRLAAVIAGCFAAGARYRPAPIEGRVALVRATDNPVKVADPLLGWGGKAVGGTELRWVPGTHTTMLRPPHATALAEVVDDILASGAAAPGDDHFDPETCRSAPHARQLAAVWHGPKRQARRSAEV